MLKVLKFGGSSLADSSQFAKVKEIVESDSSREVVIVSAPGKRDSEDNKITDLLYLTHAHLRYGVAHDGVLSMIKKRYSEIRKGCGIEINIESIVDETLAGINKKTLVDFIASRGEYFSALLMAKYLGYQFVDAVDWLCFEYNGKVNAEKSEEKLRELKNKYGRIVTPGFYGALPNGRIVDNPKTIARVTYDELRELSYMGASVLHEDTVFPVRIRDIPVNIRNTNAPDDPGTIIREHFDDELEEETERFITGIAGKRNFSIISIYKSRIGEEKLGLLREVLEVFANYEIPVEQIPSGVDSFSVVFPSSSLGGRKHELMQELSDFESIDNCTLTEGVSLIAIVGRQMAYRTGISGKIFKTLGENKINIRTIEQCADEINIMVGVYDEDFNKAIRLLYESFAK